MRLAVHDTSRECTLEPTSLPHDRYIECVSQNRLSVQHSPPNQADFLRKGGAVSCHSCTPCE